MTSTADVWPVPPCGPTELLRWPFGTMVAAMLRRPGVLQGGATQRSQGTSTSNPKISWFIKKVMSLLQWNLTIVVPDVCTGYIHITS